MTYPASDTWHVERMPAHEPKLRETWRYRSGRKKALVLVWLTGQVEWCVWRPGERPTWHRAPHDLLENAKLLAEIAIEDMPAIGPLEQDQA